MKKVYRIFVILVTLVGIILSISLYSLFRNVPFVSDAVGEALLLRPWLNNIFAVISCILGLLFLAFIPFSLLLPSRFDFLVIEKGDGRLLISKKTIESTVKYSFTDITGVNYLDIRARLGKSPEKTRIYIKLSFIDSAGLVDTTEIIRQRIETALLASLGIEITAIIIKIVEPYHNVKDDKLTEARSEAAAGAASDTWDGGKHTIDTMKADFDDDDGRKADFTSMYSHTDSDDSSGETLSSDSADAIIKAFASVRAEESLRPGGIFAAETPDSDIIEETPAHVGLIASGSASTADGIYGWGSGASADIGLDTGAIPAADDGLITGAIPAADTIFEDGVTTLAEAYLEQSVVSGLFKDSGETEARGTDDTYNSAYGKKGAGFRRKRRR